MRVLGYVCLLLTLAEISAAQDTNFPVGPQYLIPAGSSSLFLHPIATPTMSFDSGLTAPQASEAAAEPTARVDDQTFQAVNSILDEQRRTALFRIYYSLPQPGVDEIALGEPAFTSAEGASVSTSESGVVQLINAQDLRDGGYGVTVSEAATHGKAYQHSGRRVYTNDDLQRLR